MRRILVATHGRSTADGALRVARALAARTGATLGVVTVLPPLPTYEAPRSADFLWHPELRRACEEDLLTRVRAQIDRTADDAAQPLNAALLSGHPARAIAQEAERRQANLVVLGIGKYAPADRVFGGEVALEVARWCPVPVLAVAPGTTTLPHRAVAATDFSRSSISAARTALELLDPDGQLSLVHVCPDVDLPPQALDEWRTHYCRIANAFLARAAHDAGADGGDHVELLQLTGDPAREILAFANRIGADLIATGSHGYHVVERILIGSVAAKLVRASHCSVLLAPSSATAVERDMAWRADRVMLPGVP